MTHETDTRLMNRFCVAVAGVGGTGSCLLTKLARVHIALRGLGHAGFGLRCYDPDKVEEHNIGRQLFYPSDLGQPKAEVLVERLNMTFNLGWTGEGTSFKNLGYDSCDVLFTCVDKRRERRAINKIIKDSRQTPLYHIDCGNGRDHGQVILGQPPERLFDGHRPTKKVIPRDLPHVYDFLPSLVKGRDSVEENCSLALALNRQSLMVNDMMAVWAADIFQRMLRDGKLAHHGVFINLATGMVRSCPVPEPEEKEERRW